MTGQKTNRGRIWVAVVLVIILVFPTITFLLLREGFDVREHAKPSTMLLPDSTHQLIGYSFISHRGDTIYKQRMLNKVCVLDFLSGSCGKSIDAKGRKLFELQEDYYGKTIDFRILSITLTPEQDSTHKLQLLSDRYAGREIWHFLRSDDSSAQQLFEQCRSVTGNNSDTDLFCQQSVYLVDAKGNIRGTYHPTIEAEYDALYQDILFLLNQVDVKETN